MKNVIKIILIAIMISFIAFSITNFISVELKATSEPGTWVQVGSDWVCKGDGSECGGADDD